MFPLDEKYYVLGFDPGGPDGFGWSICEVMDGLVLPSRGGAASHVAEVMDKVVNYIHRQANILGIGIAAPLFWTPTGTRRVDGIVRDALAASGHPAPTEPVKAFGALTGERLAQGLLLASNLWEHFTIPITETNPKALLWLLDPELKRDQEISEDTPDAVVSALAAWCVHERLAGWRDLYAEEPNALLPFGTPVSYWMPVP